MKDRLNKYGEWITKQWWFWLITTVDLVWDYFEKIQNFKMADINIGSIGVHYNWIDFMIRIVLAFFLWRVFIQYYKIRDELNTIKEQAITEQQRINERTHANTEIIRVIIKFLEYRMNYRGYFQATAPDEILLPQNFSEGELEILSHYGYIAKKYRT